MDGKNSSGRKISLLNDSSLSDVGPLVAKPSHHSSFATIHSHSHQQYHNSHSRVSSCASTPALSPQTPQLVRSYSSDSRGFASPTPSTPSFASFRDHVAYFNQRHSQQQYYLANARTAKMDDPSLSMYPPLDNSLTMAAPYQVPTQVIQQQLHQQQLQLQQQQQQQIQPQPHMLYRASTSPSSEPSRVSTASANSNNNAKAIAPKKNQYPCPMAKQYTCNDYFTTSGHAARHAKKHTGKKDAFCPECNKAFTRKDNMEQHRRTHQNGRGGGRTSGTDETSKVRKPAKPVSKRSVIKPEPVLDAIELELAQQQQDRLEAPIAMQPMPLSINTLLPEQILQQQVLLPDPTFAIPAVSGPYYVGTGVADPGPVPPLPMPMNETLMRPPLHRSNYTTTLDYIPPVPMMLSDPDLNFSYPSPGLSSGLTNLAIAAGEHRRLSEEKSRSPSSDDETPFSQT
jgi:hypothetical protein